MIGEEAHAQCIIRHVGGDCMGSSADWGERGKSGSRMVSAGSRVMKDKDIVDYILM